MPRRRPPGAAPGMRGTTTTAFLALLFVLPLIASAAQQQQPSPDHAHRRSPREDVYLDTITPQKSRKAPNNNAHNTHGHVRNASKRDAYTPLISEDARALATKVSSAPANAAVRAPSTNDAADGGLTTRSRARSLQDWEVEDFVLLATVDGRIHARDRYNGDEIWMLDLDQPMLETMYNQNDSNSNSSPQNKPFIWIVEPKEDGALYILTPGPQPILKSLGMTVKQLTEELSPYSSDDPPVVYTAEKRNIMLVVDARSGNVTKSFSSHGSVVLSESDSCETTEKIFGSTKERECKGFFNLGRTEYIVSVHNKITGENICTIKYSEWTPNNRDKDLHAQYDKTMDEQYIYSTFNGHAIAYAHNRPKKAAKRPVFDQDLASPVVRVFDVARPEDDKDPEPALVLLPQPPMPGSIEEKLGHVWLNTTESGSWYALSEAHYPAVTDRAPPALCYSPEWTSNELLNLDGPHMLPDRVGLVGVHVLDHVAEHRPNVPRLDAPPPSEAPIVPRPVLPTQPHQELAEDPPESPIEPIVRTSHWVYTLIALFLLVPSGYFSIVGQPAVFDPIRRSLLSRLGQKGKPLLFDVHGKMSEEPIAAADIKPDSAPPIANEQEPELPRSDSVVEKEHPQPHVESEPEKKVRFEIPVEEEEEFESLSRTTTGDLDACTVDIETAGATPATEEGTEDAVAPATPTKKKKTHRGKRGGQKKPRKPKEEDEVDRIVNAAKELDQTPSLHPDELAVNGDDVQDVANVKKIGKLTIDFDRLLGNGSGGTFVFEGKWKDQVVAVKRMLPQYFGLAEQEVKLLQEGGYHKNVIRYFDDEKDENFLYIAVELCQASLFDLYRDGRPGEELSDCHRQLVNAINADIPWALFQLADGLSHLHTLRVIHRDIKPQNILIAYPQRGRRDPRLVISDFGLCKTLPDNVSTLIGTTGNAGTVGWKAPELILQPKDMDRGSSTGHSRESSSSTDPVAQGVKRAVDIFSLGCVFFYILTQGSHPFDDEEGWMQMRELNIKKNKANFDQLEVGDDSEEPKRLISWMLSNQPEYRPTASQVMSHPFFWDPEKRLNFLCDCSDHWEREIRDPPSEQLLTLESYSPVVIGDKKPDFLLKLHRSFVASLGKQRKYTGDRMLDLLRALRNKKNHYEDMDESVKTMVGPLPEGYLSYWTTRFPRLVMSCYDAVVECGLENESRFRRYFEVHVPGS